MVLLVDKMKKLAPKLSANLNVDLLLENFDSRDSEDKGKLILSLINIMNGKVNKIDTEAFGGAKNAGCLKFNYDKELNTGELVLVDRSITGMLEKRTQITGLE